MGRKVKTPPTKERESDILTPNAPSIAFPLANPPVAPEPQVKIHIYINNMSANICIHTQMLLHNIHIV